MRLKKLPEEERLEIAGYLARSYSVAEARRIFYSQREYIPEEDRIGYPTFLAYANSSQGKAEVKASRKALQEKAPTSPYMHRGERADVLVKDNLTKLLEKFRKENDTKLLVSLSSEIRQVIREIREEAIPYDTEGVNAKSPYEEFLKQMALLTPDMQDFIAGKGAEN